MERGRRQHVYWSPAIYERGVALAMLLWFLAAMTMLVASISYLARTDLKLTQLQVAEAKAKAAGDGAIRLMLADVFASEVLNEGINDELSIRSGNFDFNGTLVRVDVVPINSDVEGLVDLNTASLDSLQLVLEDSAKLSAVDATTLADEIQNWRKESEDGAFRAIEDLMLVDGMGRVIFESFRDFVYVLPQGGSNSYRVDAYISEGSRFFLRRRWIDTSQKGLANLPWRYFRTEAIRSVSLERI